MDIMHRKHRLMFHVAGMIDQGDLFLKVAIEDYNRNDQMATESHVFKTENALFKRLFDFEGKAVPTGYLVDEAPRVRHPFLVRQYGTRAGRIMLEALREEMMGLREGEESRWWCCGFKAPQDSRMYLNSVLNPFHIAEEAA